MAQVPAAFGPITWDTVKSTVTLTLYADDAPEPPDDGALYSAPTGSQLTMEVPVRKAVTDPPTIVKIETSPTGAIYTRYTWSGTAWGSPVRVNADGSVWTG